MPSASCTGLDDLRQGLLGLVSDDPATARRATECILSRISDRLSADVEAVTSADTFPIRAWWRAGARHLIAETRRPSLLYAVTQDATREERIPEPPAKMTRHLSSIEAHAKAARQAGRELLADIIHGCHEVPDDDLRGVALGQVLPHATAAVRHAPEAIWAVFGHVGCDCVSTQLLTTAGPPTAPMFLTGLLTRYLSDDGFRARGAAALVSVGRGDDLVVDTMLEKLRLEPSRMRLWEWAKVLHGLGESAAKEVVLCTLHEMGKSVDAERRGVAAMTLPPIAPHDPATADLLLALLHDDDPSVIFEALEGVRPLSQFSDRLAPRVVELLGRCGQEDKVYHGQFGLIAGTLIALGPSAAAMAVPKVLQLLPGVEPCDRPTLHAVLNAACGGR